MTNRFRSYEELPENYKPDNQIKVVPQKLVSYQKTPPYFDFNLKGEFIGYWWNYGDTLYLPFTFNEFHYVEDDALLYTTVAEQSYIDPNIVIGERPTTQTQGYDGQRAYNLMTGESWTYKGISMGDFIWQSDPSPKYPEKSTRLMMFRNIDDRISTYNVKLEIVDFRHQVLYSTMVNGQENIHFLIDEELSKKLLKDTYLCKFTVYDGDKVKLEKQYSIIVK